MKKFFQFILIALTVLVCGMSASAQTSSGQRLSREELAVQQAKYIAKELALDGATTQKYVIPIVSISGNSGILAHVAD